MPSSEQTVVEVDDEVQRYKVSASLYVKKYTIEILREQLSRLFEESTFDLTYERERISAVILQWNDSWIIEDPNPANGYIKKLEILTRVAN